MAGKNLKMRVDDYKKRSSEFLADKKEFFGTSWIFSRKKSIFFQNLKKMYRNFTLGFLGFYYLAILGFSFFLSGNADANTQSMCRYLQLFQFYSVFFRINSKK